MSLAAVRASSHEAGLDDGPLVRLLRAHALGRRTHATTGMRALRIRARHQQPHRRQGLRHGHAPRHPAHPGNPESPKHPGPRRLGHENGRRQNSGQAPAPRQSRPRLRPRRALDLRPRPRQYLQNGKRLQDAQLRRHLGRIARLLRRPRPIGHARRRRALGNDRTGRHRVRRRQRRLRGQGRRPQPALHHPLRPPFKRQASPVLSFRDRRVHARAPGPPAPHRLQQRPQVLLLLIFFWGGVKKIFSVSMSSSSSSEKEIHVFSNETKRNETND
mmetsp:Transcript_7838/g.24194  ORF Transcript_7838/g.24194 Transcript_7838/m.24194 type:complete len:273 (-) Transcript_7838:639-1457(-)